MQSSRQGLLARRVRAWGEPAIPGRNTLTYWAVSSVLPMALTVTFQDSGEPRLWRLFRPDIAAALATHESWQGDGAALWVANPTDVCLSLCNPGQDAACYYVFDRADVESFCSSAARMVPEESAVPGGLVDAFLAELFPQPGAGA